MFSFVQKWFGPRGNAIGVDFGSEALRLAQVENVGVDFRLVAAATADVPAQVRRDPIARISFFIESVREMLATAPFRGRQAVLALPSASMFFQHLRMPKMDDEALSKALPWEVRGKLPIDPSHAVMRHIVAGDVYHDQDPKNEVIVMAASRDLVDQFLTMASRARLEIVGMDVEPKALLDGFLHLQRQKDSDATNLFVDIGASGSRAIITRGTRVVFARAIPIGGDHFNRAVAAAMKLGLQDAKLLRIQTAAAQPNEAASAAPVAPAQPAPPPQEQEGGFALLNAALQSRGEAPAAVAEPPPSPVAAAVSPESARLQNAIQEPLQKLVEELRLCRRYHESTFPSNTIDRMVFVGGEAHNRALCQSIARQMGLAAQIGDPLSRFERFTEIELPLDLQQPQPAWAVAIGLSIGSGIRQSQKNAA
jgi:type IV pilus assembly protein PilM